MIPPSLTWRVNRALLIALVMFAAALALVHARHSAAMQLLIQGLIVALLVLSVTLALLGWMQRPRHGRAATSVELAGATGNGAADRNAIGTPTMRSAELAILSRQLQQLTEKEKAQLARSLHDELGGLLIAVKMDTSWLQKRWANPPPDVQARWERVFKVLDEGVDFKRRVVEHLRPTLLDNMGLLTALRWVTQETCGRAGLSYTESYPDAEPVLDEDVSILAFRLVQEALTNVVSHAHASEVRIELSHQDHQLILQVEDNGVGIGREQRNDDGTVLHGLTIMELRVSSLGGALEVKPLEHGTLLRARLPSRANAALSRGSAASENARRALI